jgi:aspartate ammonia-lyase
MNTRVEYDLLGAVEVPEYALYGAQTQRAVANFPLSMTEESFPARTIGSFPTLVRGLLLIKKAAACANQELGLLDAEKAQSIQSAADQLLAGAPAQHFPVHYLHGGGGTSANMNANEVLANLAEELLGGRRGEYRLVHPNDHVNLNQSTNDVYPTACHMAVILAWPALQAELLDLARGLEECVDPLAVHLARTCLQDAVEIRFSDYFSGIAVQVRRLTTYANEAADRLHSVNLGGTICGRAADVPLAYLPRIVPVLAQVTGDARYTQAPNLFDAAQNPDELAAVSAALDRLARGLVKIAKDLRLLSSGPEAGIGDICLPAMQPGSSIMPGKVNPVMPEFLVQICFRVMGNHAMCASGLDHGELDLNVWESSMVFPVLESFELLTCAVRAFREKCVSGLAVPAETNQAHIQTIIPRLTALAGKYGYSRVNTVCKEARGDLDLLKKRLDEVFKE